MAGCDFVIAPGVQSQSVSGFYIIFHAIAFYLIDYAFGMMQEAVEDRISQDAVVVEDFNSVCSRDRRDYSAGLGHG